MTCKRRRILGAGKLWAAALLAGLLAPAASAQAITQAELQSGLAGLLRGAGGGSGAWVADADSESVLFASADGTPRALASNSKLFTTATALAKFGPAGQLETTASAAGTVGSGVLTGSLVLRGDGDPMLDTRDLGALAAKVSAAGITQVTGPLIYDESAFDRRRSVPQTGVRRESLGPALSGLIFAGGTRRGAARFSQALRKRGIVMPRGVRRGVLPDGSQRLAAVASPPMSDLARLTNVPSNNFLAEALVKSIGSHFGSGGSTAAGTAVIRSFAGDSGASLSLQNGSGLSVKNRASPRSVGEFLDSILEQPEEIANAFTGSLAVAGRSGTLKQRMRGSSAAGRCRAKTGTLRGVSALSGYCFTGTRATVFSFLMNRVNVYRAQWIQDRMTALVARYTP